MANLQVGNVTSTIRRTIKDEDGTVVDISTASAKVFYLKSPKGKLLTKTASFTTSGTDGQMQCTTSAGDLDTPGQWTLQAKITISSQVLWSNVVTLPVLGNVTP